MIRGKAWATVAFLLGVGVSVAANVAHTFHPSDKVLQAAGKTAEAWHPELGAQAMAAFYPLALLLVVEILARAPWPRSFGWSAARYGGAFVVAGVAAVVSYRHMAGLLSAYGEDSLTAAIGPLAVDGLMVVASFALLAIGKAKPAEEAEAVPAGKAWVPVPVFDVEVLADEEPAEVHPELDGWVPNDGPTWWPPFVPEEADVPESEAGVPAVPEVYPEAVHAFAGELENGRVPGIRKIKKTLQIGQPKAAEVREYLTVLASR